MGDHTGKPKEDKPFDPQKDDRPGGTDTGDGTPPPGKHEKPKGK
jgi:hypothetical protein